MTWASKILPFVLTAQKTYGTINKTETVRKPEQKKRGLQRSVSCSYEKNKAKGKYCKTLNAAKKKKKLFTDPPQNDEYPHEFLALNRRYSRKWLLYACTHGGLEIYIYYMIGISGMMKIGIQPARRESGSFIHGTDICVTGRDGTTFVLAWVLQKRSGFVPIALSPQRGSDVC